MRFDRFLVVASVLLWMTAGDLLGQSVLGRLPILPNNEPLVVKWDYLVDEIPLKSSAYRSEDGRDLILDNGLLRRSWRINPNLACFEFINRSTGESLLRAVEPEALITLDGTEYSVGGLTGQPNHAFLKPEWLDQMRPDPKGFSFVDFEVKPTAPRLAWHRRRHAAPDAQWPPPGVRCSFRFRGPQDLPVSVTVHYELYDGAPVMTKWLTITNESSEKLRLNRLTTEQLAVVEHANWVEAREGVDQLPPQSIHVETDYAFGGFNFQNANRHVVHWRSDPDYQTQVNYLRQTPCRLEVMPTVGPDQEIAPRETWASYHTFELLLGPSDRERRGLALRRMYRLIAPWATENPITHHLLSHDPQEVRQAIDQAAAVGFEAIILSFGSGFNMENQNREFLGQWKAVADYAESRGVELGSYSLFSSRNVGQEHMIVSPPGQKPTHGQCPAVTSQWGQNWVRTIQQFYDVTGFDQFENDGPYPGDIDITPRPPLQRGELDSRWVQWRATTEMYKHLRGKGIYINAPDYYFLNGTNKCGMGYREVNWSLPRSQQVIHTRQNIFDGTWTRTPSMGWMFVPLTQYHGGGAAATIEPLDEHLDHYQRMLSSNLALGVQAHYRGPRLYDTDRTRQRVKHWVDWFHTYRDILESDLIHGRRADGRELDWMLHVNPRLERRGMLCVFNPTDEPATQTLRVNVYYTGLQGKALVAEQDRQRQSHNVDHRGWVELGVSVPAGGMNWYVLYGNEPQGSGD